MDAIADRLRQIIERDNRDSEPVSEFLVNESKKKESEVWTFLEKNWTFLEEKQRISTPGDFVAALRKFQGALLQVQENSRQLSIRSTKRRNNEAIVRTLLEFEPLLSTEPDDFAHSVGILAQRIEDAMKKGDEKSGLGSVIPTGMGAVASFLAGGLLGAGSSGSSLPDNDEGATEGSGPDSSDLDATDDENAEDKSLYPDEDDEDAARDDVIDKITGDDFDEVSEMQDASVSPTVVASIVSLVIALLIALALFVVTRRRHRADKTQLELCSAASSKLDSSSVGSSEAAMLDLESNHGPRVPDTISEESEKEWRQDRSDVSSESLSVMNFETESSMGLGAAEDLESAHRSSELSVMTFENSSKADTESLHAANVPDTISEGNEEEWSHSGNQLGAASSSDVSVMNFETASSVRGADLESAHRSSELSVMTFENGSSVDGSESVHAANVPDTIVEANDENSDLSVMDFETESACTRKSWQPEWARETRATPTVGDLMHAELPSRLSRPPVDTALRASYQVNLERPSVTSQNRRFTEKSDISFSSV